MTQNCTVQEFTTYFSLSSNTDSSLLKRESVPSSFGFDSEVLGEYDVRVGEYGVELELMDTFELR